MDREKVIKGLETCIPMKYETNEEKECRHEQCPYGRENYKPMNGCFWDLMEDALALLKEQEAEIHDLRSQIAMLVVAQHELCEMMKEQPEVIRCKDCKKRESWECWQYFFGRIKIPDDWFCADGVRKECIE